MKLSSRILPVIWKVLLGICFVLFLVTALLMVRSYYAYDMFDRQNVFYDEDPKTRDIKNEHYRELKLISEWGRIYIVITLKDIPFLLTERPNPGTHITFEHGQAVPSLSYAPEWKRTGFGLLLHDDRDGEDRISSQQLRIPHWFAAMVLGSPVAATYVIRWFSRKRRRQRSRRGLCIYCGYDLRTSNGRCPECGQKQL